MMLILICVECTSQYKFRLSYWATWRTTCVCAVWASAILCVVRRPVRTTGARMPHLPLRNYHGFASVLVCTSLNVMTLTIISWYWLTFIYLLFSFIYTSCAVNCVSVIMQYIFFLHSFIKYTCSEGIILHTNTTALRHFFTNWFSILTFPSFSTPLIGPAFSCPANSTLANWCRKFMSRVFSRPQMASRAELRDLVLNFGTPFVPKNRK